MLCYVMLCIISERMNDSFCAVSRAAGRVKYGAKKRTETGTSSIAATRVHRRVAAGSGRAGLRGMTDRAFAVDQTRRRPMTADSSTITPRRRRLSPRSALYPPSPTHDTAECSVIRAPRAPASICAVGFRVQMSDAQT